MVRKIGINGSNDVWVVRDNRSGTYTPGDRTITPARDVLDNMVRKPREYDLGREADGYVGLDGVDIII